MNVIRAEHLGMCFGVRDAIALAHQHAASQPVTILGELVHNEAVINELRAAGVIIESDPGKVKTPVAIVTAHGASDKSMQAAREHGLELHEATCPLVRNAHRAVHDFVRDGYHPVIIGKKGHVEVRGITEDLESCDVVESHEDIDRLAFRPRIGIAAQTTQPIARVREFVQRVRDRFPSSDIRFADTVCQPTKQRQNAAAELARKCDVVVVIGGANSNNTKELVRTSEQYCPKVYHVTAPDEIEPGWFRGTRNVGITAGTSTPDYLINAIEARIESLS